MREHRPRTRDRCILEDESSLVRTRAEISARFRGENPDGSLCIFARCAQLGFSGNVIKSCGGVRRDDRGIHSALAYGEHVSMPPRSFHDSGLDSEGTPMTASDLPRILCPRPDVVFSAQ